MDTALALFAGQGYHSTSIADIVKKMGVARGTFYRYFTDKHDLFDQLLENNFRYVKWVLPTLPEDRSISATDLETILTTAFLELLSRPDSQHFISMMVNEAAGADVVFAEKINTFYDDLAEIFKGYISMVQKRGLIDGRNPGISAYLILGALKEIFIQWARGEKFKNLEVLIHEVASFIVYGIRPGARVES